MSSGDFVVGDTLYFLFTTRRFTTGVPFTLAGSPIISAYEDDSVTQITAGVSLGVDHDTVTGLNLITVVASGANGFEAGKQYSLVITVGTVDSVSVVGEVVAEFSLEAISSLRPTTAGRTLTIESDGMAHSDVKEIEGSDATNQIRDSIVDDATRFSGASIAAILTDTGTTLQAELDYIQSVVDAILVDTGTDGVVVAVGGIGATAFAAGAIDAAALNSSAVDEILDDTIGDTTITLRQAMRIMVAVLVGKLSGAATTNILIRNAADDKNVVDATVDVDGNRTVVTLNP